MSKILRYWKKKHGNRSTHKKVRYGCRQNLAKQRFRYQGRFIKKEEMAKLDPSEIYDPSTSCLPKLKSIFKVTKEARGRSSSLLGSETTREHYDFLKEFSAQADGVNLLSPSLPMVFNQEQLRTPGTLPLVD